MCSPSLDENSRVPACGDIEGKAAVTGEFIIRNDTGRNRSDALFWNGCSISMFAFSLSSSRESVSWKEPSYDIRALSNIDMEVEIAKDKH